MTPDAPSNPESQAPPVASREESFFGSASILGSLRELESTGASPIEMLRDRKSGMPSAWQRVSRWKRPFVLTAFVLRRAFGYLRRLAIGIRWLLRRWLRRRPGLVGQVGETVLWPVVLLWISWLSNPDNPFYVNEGFPWPWLGAWLIALRYGTLAGVIAALELLGAWYLMSGGALATPPKLYFLGGGIVTMICGEFGSFWGARAGRFREATRYLDDRIDRLTRRLYLLKLSHDELEFELIDRPGTLRDSLTELRAILEAHADVEERLPGAQSILEFLAHYCQIEAGGIYEYLTTGPRAEIRQVAIVGSASAPDANDPMVQHAVETGQSVHLQETLVHSSRRSSLLVVAPMQDERGETVGLLVVNRLPFMALNPDNLRNMWVLLQSYAEYLRQRALSLEYLPLWPDAPPDLRHEFAWLQRLQLDFGLQSWCLVWRVAHLNALDILEQVRSEHEGGEMAWIWRQGDSVSLISLMPFMGVEQVKLEVQRIKDSLSRTYGPAIGQSLVFSVEIWLGQPNAYELMREMLEYEE
ncbi:MAG: PelD GGDEF domain-containing protein [Burkholderiaceae bacterium]|nr:PelD GGDEF domain-containing protein [Burkholderiaceae bacterium]